MPTQNLTLRHCSDGYYRTTWYDDRGEPHSRSFGRRKRAAETAFSQFHATWHKDPTVRHPSKGPILTVEMAWQRFAEHAEDYYRHADGSGTRQAENIDLAFRPVIKMYGGLPVAAFGPKLLKSVRDQLVRDQLCRNVVNQRVRYIRQVFKWLASEELVPASVWHALQTVSGLEAGRSEAVESEPVIPVPEAHIWAVSERVPGPVRAMIALQYWSACRPGEACIMRPRDIETGPAVWRWKPSEHKGAWRSQTKIVLLGPKAQEAIQPYLTRELTAFCFSPMEAQRERFSNCKVHRHQAVRQPATARRVRDRYETMTYANAIRYACRALDVPEWSPNQLRHNALTRLEQTYGIELARIVAGHTTSETTEVYLERDLRRAVEAVMQAG